MTKYRVTLDYETDAENLDEAITLFVDAFVDYVETGIINEKLIITVSRYAEEKDTIS